MSISKTWLRTGTTSLESGIAKTLILVLAAPSIFEILVIFVDVKIISPVV